LLPIDVAAPRGHDKAIGALFVAPDANVDEDLVIRLAAGNRVAAADPTAVVRAPWAPAPIPLLPGSAPSQKS